MITLIIQILDKLGKGIVLREMVALFSNFHYSGHAAARLPGVQYP